MNRYYTVLVVPEKTSRIRRLVIPSWMVKSAGFGIALAGIVAIVMLLDYWFVMNQISETKLLKVENRKYRQQVDLYKAKISNIENTLERVRTFTTRLKVITNIEDKSALLESLNKKLPDAASNIGDLADLAEPGGPGVKDEDDSESDSARAGSDQKDFVVKTSEEQSGAVESSLFDSRLENVQQHSSYIEQEVQDLYELLADKKAFLAALPTRKPAAGYFTSGFGVRKSPYGGKVKMHEGIDIANKLGTPIYATANGIVSFSNSKPGYGQILIIDHGYGLETWYAHVRKILVSKGQHVKRGDSVALLGSSGRSTGPHLHYEVRVRGTPFDPRSYILEN